jgi:hypothetical protein
MPRPSVRHRIEPFTWPKSPDPENFPHYADRRFLAAIHRQYYGPLSEHSLPTWPLDWIIVNGRAVGSTRDFLAEAERRFEAARRVFHSEIDASR